MVGKVYGRVLVERIQCGTESMVGDVWKNNCIFVSDFLLYFGSLSIYEKKNIAFLFVIFFYILLIYVFSI